MKILGQNNGGVIVELTNGEFGAITGKSMEHYYVGRTIEVCALTWRTKDVLEAQGKLQKVAETLRGLATVISTVDALVPASDQEGAKP